MSIKQDEVAIRCPNCGSMAAGRVSHEERMAGTAKVRCLICKRIVPVPVPLLGECRSYQDFPDALVPHLPFIVIPDHIRPE